MPGKQSEKRTDPGNRKSPPPAPAVRGAILGLLLLTLIGVMVAAVLGISKLSC